MTPPKFIQRIWHRFVGEKSLSRDKAERTKTWDMLADAFENELPVTCTLAGRVKGGYTVEINEVRAFLPGSLLNLPRVREDLSLLGVQFDVIVIKFNPSRPNVVVSRRAALEAETRTERQALLESLEEGRVVKCVVTNLKQYGAFVDVGGIDGLLHITDMAWRRIRHPSEIVEIGDEIEVRVLFVDRERCRVGLGIKQLGDDPWASIKGRYQKGTKHQVVVRNICGYGCFAEIEPGIEGLVHVSEMDWTNRNAIPSNVVTVGEEVEVMILDVDEERRRVSLGIKQCRENPCVEFSKTHSPGDRIRGLIKSITDLGIFVVLDGGVEGLADISDLSWKEAGDVAIRRYFEGEEVDAVILGIDVNRGWIALGIKQLESDVPSEYATENWQGAVVQGVVNAELEARQAGGVLGEADEGTPLASKIGLEHLDQPRYGASEGNELGAKIGTGDVENRPMELSVKTEK